MTRGIGDIPLDLPPQHYRVLSDMREQLVELRGTLAPPATPGNFAVTPQAFSNLVQWSRVNDADFYEVRHGFSANAGDATVIVQDVGSSQQWVDHVGNNGITKFYWVRAAKLTGARSQWTTTLSGTTLTSATGVTPPNPPPPRIIVTDQTTGQRIPYEIARDQQL